MLKVLIADDEALEREVYKVMIARNFPGLEVVAEAETGRQAVELYERFKPELILMDVKMPGINGIEAIDAIRKSGGYTKFVIISAYNYFEYAKEALKHGVEDYLLKPVAREEFVKVLQKVLVKIEDEISMSREDLEIREKLKSILPILENEIIFALMLGDDSRIKQYSSLLNLDLSCGYVMVGMLNEESIGRMDEISRSLVSQRIYEFVRHNMPELKPCLISPFISGKMIFIIPGRFEKNSVAAKETAYKNASRVQNTILENFRVKMSFGIGEAFESTSEIKESYNQATAVISNIDSLGMDIIDYGDIKGSISRQFRYPYEMERQLMEKMRLGLEKQSISVFQGIFDYTAECFSLDANRVKFELLELYFALSRMIFETEDVDTGLKDFVMGKEKYFHLNTLQEIYRIFEADIAFICGRFREARNLRAKSIIHDAIEYIKKNYMKEITLEEVAKSVCISPNYFSRLFKNELDKSFIDYLTQTRVEIAKSLILKTNKSIRDICWDVGYNDPNYFTKVFKKVTNHTPSEFRDMQ